MEKVLKLEICAYCTDDESEIDLEIIREFKDLMNQIKQGKNKGQCFMNMEYGIKAEGKFTITPRGLQIE